jgi:hypothetical protein
VNYFEPIPKKESLEWHTLTINSALQKEMVHVMQEMVHELMMMPT